MRNPADLWNVEQGGTSEESVRAVAIKSRFSREVHEQLSQQQLSRFPVLSSRYFPEHSVRTDRLRSLAHRVRHTCAKEDRKSTRLNSSHVAISYAVFCLNKKRYKHLCFM